MWILAAELKVNDNIHVNDNMMKIMPTFECGDIYTLDGVKSVIELTLADSTNP